uniref:Zinc finger protein basonuclin-2-like n=1 Tax=Sinocyclocheilus anshuiensis TaxID=1608454 RepID=A0A671LCN6_9TELE
MCLCGLRFKKHIIFHILYIIDAAGKVLDRWTIMSREEEIITLQQFLRFGETKSIVELMAIQEKEGQAVTVPSSKTDSGIRTFIESNNRTHSPGLLSHLENNSPSSIHHFENIPNSLAFLLPFQYINPVSAPMLGLPPNGLTIEQSGLRMREPNLPNQSEPVETSESEVSLSPFRNGQSPSRGTMGTLPNAIEPKIEPNRNEQLKTITHSSFSSKMHRMRRMGATSRKGRVCCNSCGKTFYDKGTLKIHYNAVHLKIKHRCTIEGCNMVFSSLRSRNRHSANPNPRLHMPMLRNNRDKDLIRSSSGTATPVISSAKSGFNLTSPGRPPLSFATPPLDPMIQSPLQSPLVFPSLKSVQPVQPVPPFYRTLLSPTDLVSPPVSLPTSPILPTTTNNSVTVDPMPKKKPRKSSMPVKIEKEIIDVADDYDDKDDDDDEDNSCHHHHHHGSHGSRGHGDLRCIDSFTSEDQDHERDFENESETSESKMLYRDELMDTDVHQPALDRNLGKEHQGAEDEGHLRKDLEEQNHSPPSQHQPVIKIKEEINDPTYDMFCMGQYSLCNGGMAVAAAAAASMAALHESFISSMSYGSSPPKFSSQSPDGDLCSSPDPKICYVCKKSFKSSYSVKLHYKNVHLKEMHVCTVAGCNAAFPSRRSRDRRTC